MSFPQRSDRPQESCEEKEAEIWPVLTTVPAVGLPALSALSSALPTCMQATQNIVICRCGGASHKIGVSGHNTTKNEPDGGKARSYFGW